MDVCRTCKSELMFKCFSESIDRVEFLNRDVARYLCEMQNKGYSVENKSVFVVANGTNPLIRPDITVSVWMQKQEDKR